MNTIKFSSAVSIDKGRVRVNNEDNFYFNSKYLTADNRDKSTSLSEPSVTGDVLIYGVFDGMGGESLGEMASLISAQTLGKYHSKIKSGEYKISEKLLLRVINDANSQICKKIVESGEKRIGTTFSALYINNDKARVINVGDSRVYLFRNGRLIQISEDDTTAQRLVNMGLITKEKAKVHEDRHKLTQHLGIFQDEMTIEPHVSERIAIKKGDKFLLCSDGLTDMVDDETITKTLCKNIDSRQLSSELVNLALENGGKDNVTAMVITANTQSQLPQKKELNTQSYRKTKKSNVSCVIFAAVAVLGILAAFAASKFLTVSRKDNTQSVTASKIYFSNPPENVAVGEKDFIMVSVEPSGVGERPKFSSTDNEILKIDEESGYFEALKPGSVIVKASLNNLECKTIVDIYPRVDNDTKNISGTEIEPVEDITVPNEINLYVGESTIIDYKVIPQSVDAPVYFASADTDIVEIDENGGLRGVSVGTTAVSVGCQDVIKTIVVNVSERKNTPVQKYMKKQVD